MAAAADSLVPGDGPGSQEDGLINCHHCSAAVAVAAVVVWRWSGSGISEQEID